jgi:hypothetical protein
LVPQRGVDIHIEFWIADNSTVELPNMKKFFDNPLVIGTLIILATLLIFELGIG